MGENDHFSENMKNRSKNRISHIFKLKIGVSDEFSTYISYAAGKKLISPKTKKLERFFKKCGPRAEGQFMTKTPIFSTPIRSISDIENIDLRFFKPQKLKFREKMALEPWL